MKIALKFKINLILFFLCITGSINSFANNCDANAIISIMSDHEMDSFKGKLCVHFFENEFNQEQVSKEVCNSIVGGCRYEMNMYTSDAFNGKPQNQVIDTAMLEFWENVQQVNLLEDEYSTQIGNIEFFRAVESSFSQEDRKNIPSCEEVKVFSNISECLGYDGVSEDDAALIQSFANSGRVDNLINEHSKLSSRIEESDKLSEAKRDEIFSKMADIKKKMDERLMHNGLKHIDYEKNDLLYEKLKPYSANLAGSFDGEVSANSIFLSFLPGYNMRGVEVTEQKILSMGKQTDVILGYWWQMMVEKGLHPTEYIEEFFKNNSVNEKNLKDVLKKLRLQMAKEHAEEACSPESKIAQKKFNDKGGTCSIMLDNKKKGKLKYLSLEEFEIQNAKLLKNTFSEAMSAEDYNKKKIVYNSEIADRICKNRIEIQGPFVDNHGPRSQLKGESWDKAKKGIQEEVKKKEESTSSYMSNYHAERKQEKEAEARSKVVRSKLDLIKDVKPNEVIREPVGKIAKVEEEKNSGKVSINNFMEQNKFDNVRSAINASKANPNVPAANYFDVNTSSRLPEKTKAELEIEARIRALDSQIESSKKSKKEKDIEVTDENEKSRTNITELMAEKDKLQKELEKIAKMPVAKKEAVAEHRVAKSNDDDDISVSGASGDERGSRRNRESRGSSSSSNATISNTSSDSSEVTSSPTENKSNPKSSGAIFKSEFGLTFSKGLESTSDISQIISNPSENELLRLAEKSNGEPFLINENGEVIRVVVKKDAKGKLTFEKIKLTSEQKKKLVAKQDAVRAIKEIGPDPIRKMELDRLMKQR